jgi:glycosyltransferase involved in cell wall biosynthesis
VIVIDGYSDDGAWELIQKYAREDGRIQAFQSPRHGIYQAINDCLDLAKGEYIYVATSDDTMVPDCLQKMVAALDQHPNCDICHCCLQIIDECGEPHPGKWEMLLPAKFYGDWLKRSHIRYPPIDAVLYCCLNTVYSSLTQLLIRRSLFDRVGYFKTQYGSQGDLEWALRATLSCQTLHWPEYLATWRRHPLQASQDDVVDSAQGRNVLVSIIQELFETRLNLLRIPLSQLTYCYRFERLQFLVRQQQSLPKKVAVILSSLFSDFDIAVQYILDRSRLLPFNRIRYANGLLNLQGIDDSYIRRVKNVDT